MNNTIFSTLLHVSFLGAVLAAVVLCVTTIGRQRIPAKYRFLLWCVVLLRFAVPFSLESRFSIFTLLETPKTVAEKPMISKPLTPQSHGTADYPPEMNLSPHLRFEQENIAQNPANGITAQKTEPVPVNSEKSWNLRQFAFPASIFIWCTGTVFMFVRLFRSEISLWRRRRNWVPIDSGPIAELFLRCKHELGVHKNVTLFFTPESLGAASCGIFRTAIVLSKEMEKQFSIAELRLILLHELMHHQRRDPLTNFLSQVVVAVHWPNPFAWYLDRALRIERELAVDESLLSRTGTGNALTYGETILKTARHFALVLPNPNLVGAQSIDNILQKRITMIIKHRKSTLLSTIFNSVLGFLVLGILVLTGLTDAKTQNAASTSKIVESQTAENTGKTPIKISGTIVDEDGTTPVPHAEIQCLQIIGGEAESQPPNPFQIIKADANGKFSATFPAISSDTPDVYISCSIYSPDNTKSGLWDFVGFDRNPVQEATIPISAKARIVTGTVKDEAGNPITGAVVGGISEPLHIRYTETDETGQFKLTFPEKVSLLQFYALKPGVGFTYIYTEENLPWEKPVPNEKRIKNPISLVLKKPQTVKVLVKNETGTPLPNCVVHSSSLRFESYPKKHMYHWFSSAYNTSNAKTDEHGIAVLDWIPAQGVEMSLRAAGPKEGITTAGQTHLYGDSNRVKWKPGEITEITLPRAIKLVFKFVREDGSSVDNQGAFLTWKSETRPISGESINVDKNGVWETVANVGDQFDLHTIGFRKDRLVTPSICGAKIGDEPSGVKEFTIVVKEGTRVFGTISDPQGNPISLEKDYSLTGCEINPNFTTKDRTDFGIRGTGPQQKSFETFLPPGEFQFKLTKRFLDVPNLLVEKTIKITDEKEIEVDLQIDPQKLNEK